MKLKRVLIVDDTDAIVELTKFVMIAAGYEVATAATAHQALLHIMEVRPELVLMDIQMPVMDGIELTRRLKADPLTRHIIIVAFTAYAVKGDALGLRAAGFDGYIAKPVDVSTLGAQVGFWLEGPASARASPFVWP